MIYGWLDGTCAVPVYLHRSLSISSKTTEYWYSSGVTVPTLRCVYRKSADWRWGWPLFASACIERWLPETNTCMNKTRTAHSKRSQFTHIQKNIIPKWFIADQLIEFGGRLFHLFMSILHQLQYFVIFLVKNVFLNVLCVRIDRQNSIEQPDVALQSQRPNGCMIPEICF